MQSSPASLRETEALETSRLLGPGCSSMRHGMAYGHVYPRNRVLHHPSDSSINSQFQTSPSCSQPSIFRRSFSAGSLLPTFAATNENGETSPLSPNLQCKQHQPLSFRHVQKWVELRLENSGTVARDHLASERTFLAYMRTSLAIASTGVALVQIFSVASVSSSQTSSQRVQDYIHPLGAFTVIIGLLVLIIGVTRYFIVQVALTKGFFPVARLSTAFLAMMLGVLVTLTFGILLAERKSQ